MLIVSLIVPFHLLRMRYNEQRQKSSSRDEVRIGDEFPADLLLVRKPGQSDDANDTSDVDGGGQKLRCS